MVVQLLRIGRSPLRSRLPIDCYNEAEIVLRETVEIIPTGDIVPSRSELTDEIVNAFKP